MQIKQYKKGEAYIDTVVTVLLSLIVLALAISMFLFMYKYQKINDAAEDAVKYAAIVGEVNTSAVNQKTDNLLAINGVDTSSITYTYTTSSGSNEVQYGDTILLEMKSDIRVSFSNRDGFITIPVKITKTAVSQKYYKPESTADTTINISGGNAQKLDAVSKKPHNVNVTVHGASQTTVDEGGVTTTKNVTNPTVSVYGKNLCPINSVENSKLGALNTFVKKGVTYTFSCVETYTEEGDDPAITTGGQFKMYSTKTLIGAIWLQKDVKKSFTFVAPEDGLIVLNMYNYVSLKDIQIEVGETTTDFEKYVEPKTTSLLGNLSTNDSWNFSIPSMSPTMTIIVSDDNSLVNWVDVEYKKKVS